RVPALRLRNSASPASARKVSRSPQACRYPTVISARSITVTFFGPERGLARLVLLLWTAFQPVLAAQLRTRTQHLIGHTLLYTSIGDPGRQNTRVVIAIVFTCTFYRQGAHLRGDDLWCWSASRLNGRQGRSIAPTGPFSGEQE